MVPAGMAPASRRLARLLAPSPSPSSIQGVARRRAAPFAATPEVRAPRSSVMDRVAAPEGALRGWDVPSAGREKRHTGRLKPVFVGPALHDSEGKSYRFPAKPKDVRSAQEQETVAFERTVFHAPVRRAPAPCPACHDRFRRPGQAVPCRRFRQIAGAPPRHGHPRLCIAWQAGGSWQQVRGRSYIAALPGNCLASLTIARWMVPSN